MCEVTNSPETPEELPAFEAENDRSFFDSNKRVRLGRSRDQDGKSNIWSIEPKMVVDESVGEGVNLKSNLAVGGIVVAAALASLPLFLGLSKLFPDPSDF